MRENSVRIVRGACPSPARLPLLQRLPQGIGDEADQNMRLDASFLVMPDRANRQIGLLDSEGGLGFGQLDVGLPQRVICALQFSARPDQPAIYLVAITRAFYRSTREIAPIGDSPVSPCRDKIACCPRATAPKNTLSRGRVWKLG